VCLVVAYGNCRYIQAGVPPARVSRPLRTHKYVISPSASGGVAYDQGLTAGTVVSEPSPCCPGSGVSASPGRLEVPSGSFRGPGLLREVRGCHVWWSAHRRPARSDRPWGPGPPSPREGVRRCQVPSCGGIGAGPAACWRLLADHLSTYQHLMR
jgi:hypothetical protein